MKIYPSHNDDDDDNNYSDECAHIYTIQLSFSFQSEKFSIIISK